MIKVSFFFFLSYLYPAPPPSLSQITQLSRCLLLRTVQYVCVAIHHSLPQSVLVYFPAACFCLVLAPLLSLIHVQFFHL